MIAEIQTQLPRGIKPTALFCSVGGGGLLSGVIEGCKGAGWDDGAPFLSSQNYSGRLRREA